MTTHEMNHLKPGDLIVCAPSTLERRIVEITNQGALTEPVNHPLRHLYPGRHLQTWAILEEWETVAKIQ